MDIKCNSPMSLQSILKTSFLPSRSSMYLRNLTFKVYIKCTSHFHDVFAYFHFFLAFTKCARQRTFSLAWACRKEHKAMKDCMEKL